MKIKEVCEKTGLTDRTVRYYIECGLLTPDSKDTYAGRKNYTFTREDVEHLEKIKVLRGAGFSVEQIKTLFADRSTREAVSERLQELESDREKNEQLYEALQKADIDREVSVDELVIILSSTPTASEEVEEPRPFPYWIFFWMSITAEVILFALEQSRFGWMIEFEQHLWTDLGFIVGAVAWYTQSHWKRYTTIVGVCLFMPLVSVIGGLINCPVTFNEAHYAMIDRIPWDDNEYLLQHGFDQLGSLLTHQEFGIERWNLEKDEAVYYDVDISIRDADEETLNLSQYDVHYGDSFFKKSMYVDYENAFLKWIRIPCEVDRVCWVLSHGKEVIIRESDKTAPFDMERPESILEELCGGIDPKTGEKAVAATVNGVKIYNDQVEKRMIVNQVRNQAFIEVYGDITDEAVREQYLKKCLRAGDHDSVIDELVRAEVMRQALKEYGEEISFEFAMDDYEKEHRLMKTDETQAVFYGALQTAMTEQGVEENDFIRMSYSLQWEMLNETALKKRFVRSPYYLPGTGTSQSIDEQFQIYVNNCIKTAEVEIEGVHS